MLQAEVESWGTSHRDRHPDAATRVANRRDRLSSGSIGSERARGCGYIVRLASELRGKPEVITRPAVSRDIVIDGGQDVNLLLGETPPCRR